MKIVITGSGGRLGAALLREYGKVASASQPMEGVDLGLGSPSHVIGFNRTDLDLADFTALRKTLGQHDFDLLINAAAFTNVDLSEKEPGQAFRVNGEAPHVLAEICSEKGVRLVHISTDYVFDGDKSEPYTEGDIPRPISAYGRSKLAGETAILGVSDKHLVVRVSWVFGPDRPSFIDQIISQARHSDRVSAVADKVSTPTYTKDIAEMLLRVVAEDASPARTGDPVGTKDEQSSAGITGPSRTGISGGNGGILHIANSGQATWQEYAQHALDCCAEVGVPLKARKVEPLSMTDMQNWVARRPPWSVLSTAKYERITGEKPRPWREAVAEYVGEFVGGTRLGG